MQSSDNAMVQIGSDVNFTCVTNEDRSIRWEKHSGHANKFDVVFNGEKITTHFESRYSVAFSKFGSQFRFQLSIRSVNPDDAGFYACSETWRNLRHIAELNVFCK